MGLARSSVTAEQCLKRMGFGVLDLDMGGSVVRALAPSIDQRPACSVVFIQRSFINPHTRENQPQRPETRRRQITCPPPDARIAFPSSSLSLSPAVPSVCPGPPQPGKHTAPIVARCSTTTTTTTTTVCIQPLPQRISLLPPFPK